jgi:hypothetical protein
MYYLPNLNPLPHPNAATVYLNWLLSQQGQQSMIDLVQTGSRRRDVDHTSLPEFARPREDVTYFNRNAAATADKTQAMRDDVTMWYLAG